MRPARPRPQPRGIFIRGSGTRPASSYPTLDTMEELRNSASVACLPAPWTWDWLCAGRRSQFEALRASEPRTRRIAILLLAIAAMSAFDLLFTLTYLQGVGMVELNPVARKVMEHGSPTLLTAWKVGIVGGACLVIFLGRRARVTEIGTWFACLALMALTIHWLRYIDAASDLTPYLEGARELSGGKWLAMTSD